jgi:glycosyltransferase involved in cell wall biosynthesis
MSSLPAFAALIPAHDEAPRIAAVIAAARALPELARVVVIDDGSTDGTADIARAAGAEVLRLSPNRGKTAALAAGIAAVEARHLVLIDADLAGLVPGDLRRLIAPVAAGRADLTLSLRGNAPLTWRLVGADYLSGERVVPRALLLAHLHRLTALPRFGFEVFLNDLARKAGLRVRVVRWPGVASPPKGAKRGLWRGALADLAMIADIMATVGPARAAAQILWLATAGARPGAALARLRPSRHIGGR